MGKKLECLLKAGRNAPRALFEAALFSSIPVGVAAAVGGGLGYLASNHELALKISGFGVLSACSGLITLPIYLFGINEPHTEPGMYNPNIAIENFLDAIREYKQASEER